jgi:hypothetical protein
MGKRVTGGAGDYLRSFSTEDGKHYRGFHQNFDPAIRRVEAIREARANLSKANNPYDRRYIGSVPVTLILDWCAKNGCTYDQFARKEGDLRQRFTRYYLSRDFSKLHTQHSTTRVGTGNRIVVPHYIGQKHDNQLRKPEDGGSSVA